MLKISLSKREVYGSVSKTFRRYVNKGTEKSFYITTPIFYPNAAPHLGHLHSMVMCDVRHRWELVKNKSSFFTTGTDEHGLKIQAAAEAQNTTPKELTDRVSENFRRLAKSADIKYDRFIRTTDADHLAAVETFWNIVYDKGYIYEGEHKGWYSISDETFYPETQIEERTVNGVKKMFSLETGTEVIYETETNYFFKLSAFRQALIKHFESDPNFVIPFVKHQELLTELKNEELQDLSISRPSSRLSWGIPVPNDDSQKIYVWFDALINYITAGGFPWSETSLKTPVSSPWPATHLIGKDITKFHSIYWPAFLLAAGIELPKQVVVHSHWLSQGTKMSKSIGNVVDPFEIMDYYGIDPVRFFICENSVLDRDSNFTESRIFDSRQQIIDKYANLLNRICGKKFDIERAIARFGKGEYTGIETLLNQKDEKLQNLYKDIVSQSNSLRIVMDKQMVDFNYTGAITDWYYNISNANTLIQLIEPWTYKAADQQSENPLDDPLLMQDFAVFVGAEVTRISSILVQHMMPELASKMMDKLNVDPSKRDYSYAQFGADLTYGLGSNSSKAEVPIVRIPKRGSEQVYDVKVKAGKSKRSK